MSARSGIGIGSALVLLAARVAQRSTPQFVLNSLVGIGIAAFFALRSGKAQDAFLPGILYNAGYAVAMLISILTRWPVVGFMIGAVTTHDPFAWRRDPAIVRLCARLTWLLLIPCLSRRIDCSVRNGTDGLETMFGGNSLQQWRARNRFPSSMCFRRHSR